MYIILIMALLAVLRTNRTHRKTIKKLNAEGLLNTQLSIQNEELIKSNKHLTSQNLQLGFVNLKLCDKLHVIQNQEFRYYKPNKEISPISFN